ncbi:YopX family protein [Enterococcus avium]|uniref:YopX family protein n=1 Tax=Enterococcus avium TaxID=33945 RepID=UPI00288CD521|nr:YopX family protein [Enterococcus avium]MDT2398669.1 YopX family protein [Enterococcus avium]
MIPKFKAWDKYHEMMVSIISFDFENKIAYVEQENGDRYDIHFDNLIFLQSTGLKDKNGVEIFEGDVVQWGDTPHWEEEPIRVAVVKINPDIQFDSNVGIFQYGKFAYQDTERFLTILGNIYENPELLEAIE